jgi:hypothetical protein|nr:MAG TPA: Large polyvalent protein associated domain 29 [Caudoviricetes sp.]
MTDKERLAAIRKELKEHGYNNRRVSVRFSGYSAIYVTIKELAINKKEIENIAMKYESYSRDERTGEILSGGNTFVFVDYDYRLVA